MATQIKLKYGTLVICNPDNGIDGYNMTKHDLVKPDFTEVAIPKTSGRIKLLKGKAQTEQTSLKLEFECLNAFETINQLVLFLESIEEAITNLRNPLRTVTYGILNVDNSYTEDNCDMQFEFLDQPYKVQDSTYPYRLNFRVTFTKWGV